MTLRVIYPLAIIDIIRWYSNRFCLCLRCIYILSIYVLCIQWLHTLTCFVKSFAHYLTDKIELVHQKVCKKVTFCYSKQFNS